MKKYGAHVKEWKKHFGEIPKDKDKDGRSYEVHHLDGDISNNSIDNLICISIDEHYELHKNQGDYNAAVLIAFRMKIKPEDIADTARKGTMKRILAGTHNFQDPNFPRSLYHNIGFVVALDTRTNVLVRASKEEFDQHDYYVGANTGRKQKTVHGNRGHNKGKNWTQKQKRENTVECPYCHKSGDASGMMRWHFENCKYERI